MPVAIRWQQLLAGRLQPEDQAALLRIANRLRRPHTQPELSNKPGDWKGGSYNRGGDRYETDFSAVDPLTGEIKGKVHVPYPNYSGTLATAGGVVFTAYTDGTLVAYDLAPVTTVNSGLEPRSDQPASRPAP